MDVIREIEARIVPAMRQAAEEINRLPGVMAYVSSFDFGPTAENAGHVFAIECLLAAAPPDEPDHVALAVTVARVKTRPSIFVDVCWGDPSGHVEAELFPDPRAAFEEVLKEMEDGMPGLYESLRRAVTNGRPSA